MLAIAPNQRLEVITTVTGQLNWIATVDVFKGNGTRQDPLTYQNRETVNSTAARVLVPIDNSNGTRAVESFSVKFTSVLATGEFTLRLITVPPVIVGQVWPGEQTQILDVVTLLPGQILELRPDLGSWHIVVPWAPGGSDNGIGVNIMDYGAHGDGVHDDFPALEAAQVAAGFGGPVFFPDGTYNFANNPIQLTTSFIGTGRDLVTLKWTGAPAGGFLIDTANGAYGGRLLDMTVDGNSVDAHMIGTVTEGLDKADLMHFERCTFKNCGPNKYVIYCDQGYTPFSNGGMTGARFTSCFFFDNAHAMFLGRTEDDIIFVSCRFHMTQVMTLKPFDINNVTGTHFLNCFFTFSGEQTFIYGGLKLLMFFGAYPVSFRNCFFETGHASYTNLFLIQTPQGFVNMTDCHFNIPSAVNLTSLFFDAVSATSNNYAKTYNLFNLDKFDTVDYGVYICYQDGGTVQNTTYVTLNIGGLDQWTYVKLAAFQGVTFPVPIYRLNGIHRKTTLTFAGLHAPQHLPAGADPIAWASVLNHGTSPSKALASATNVNLYFFETDLGRLVQSQLVSTGPDVYAWVPVAYTEKPFQRVQPNLAGATTVNAIVEFEGVYLDPTGFCVGCTINFPTTSLFDGIGFLLCNGAQIVNSITLGGGAATVADPPITMPAYSRFAWKYVLATTTWVRTN